MYRISPSFPVSNLERIVSFYLSELGFKLLSDDPPYCAWIQRGWVSLGFYHVPEKHLCGNGFAFIETDDVFGLLREFEDQGLPLERTKMVVEEDELIHGFMIKDPEGNRIEFGGDVLWEEEDTEAGETNTDLSDFQGNHRSKRRTKKI